MKKQSPHEKSGAGAQDVRQIYPNYVRVFFFRKRLVDKRVKVSYITATDLSKKVA